MDPRQAVNQKAPLKRRRFIVARFQYRLISVTLAYFATAILVFAAVLFVPLILDLSNQALSLEQRSEAANQFLTLHVRLWPAFIVLLIPLTMHMILVSHRVAGPLYRFRRTFESIAEGDLSLRVRIRQRDYLEEEADSLNQMIDWLATRVRSIQERSQALNRLVAQLRRAGAAHSLAAVDRSVNEIELQVEELNQEVSRFKTGTGPTAEAEGGPPRPMVSGWKETKNAVVT